MADSADRKVGWVTGGGSGVGAATCRLLGAAGAKVLCADIDGDAAERTAANVRADGGTALAMQMDVSIEADNIAAVDRAVGEWGALHMASINAAIDPAVGRNVLDCPLDGIRKALAVIYEGGFLGIKHAARAMKDAGIRGSIVVTGSGASVRANTNNIAYSGAKHGLVGIAKLAAADLLPFGIRVNTVAPAMIDTEGLRHVLAEAGMEVPDYAEDPEVVAAEIVKLMASDSPLMTGQVIGLDRGLSNLIYYSTIDEHGQRYCR